MIWTVFILFLVVLKPVSLQNTYSHNANSQPALRYSSHALRSLRPNVVSKPPWNCQEKSGLAREGRKGGLEID